MKPVGKSVNVKIGFPVTCEYRGGNPELGRHGRHLWIEDGKIGHGELSLTHAISLASVTSVDVTEREFGGTEAQTLMAFGAQPVVTKHASKPKQVTDITVRTRDGCEALWIVEQRGADWVHKRLTPALQQARIPYYADLPPSERDG
jgi:hypothetical protein